MAAYKRVSVQRLIKYFNGVAAKSTYKVLPDDMARLREVYATFGGPLKSEKFLQLHRKFVDCVIATNIEDSISRPVWGQLVVIFIFSDVVAITRPLSYFRSSDPTALVSHSDITPGSFEIKLENFFQVEQLVFLRGVQIARPTKLHATPKMN